MLYQEEEEVSHLIQVMRIGHLDKENNKLHQ